MARQLTDVEEARHLVLEAARPLVAERVPLADALGRVLAEDVASAERVPGFDNSAMDGFAVRAADRRRSRSRSPPRRPSADPAGAPARDSSTT